MFSWCESGISLEKCLISIVYILFFAKFLVIIFIITPYSPQWGTEECKKHALKLDKWPIA